MITKVVEYVRDGNRFGLAVDEADAKRIIGSERLPLYEIRHVELDVVFILCQQDYGNGPYQPAFATYEAARLAQGKDDDIEVWEVVR